VIPSGRPPADAVTGSSSRIGKRAHRGGGAWTYALSRAGYSAVLQGPRPSEPRIRSHGLFPDPLRSFRRRPRTAIMLRRRSPAGFAAARVDSSAEIRADPED